METRLCNQSSGLTFIERSKLIQINNTKLLILNYVCVQTLNNEKKNVFLFRDKLKETNLSMSNQCFNHRSFNKCELSDEGLQAFCNFLEVNITAEDIW